MSDPLILAIPSKGRLQENAEAFFARAGLEIRKTGGSRTYMGTIEGVPGVEIAFLSASEISRQLATGAVHLGVTGEDLLRENIPDAEAKVHILAPLGFGFANVVVAVPQSWIDVATMEDLNDVAMGRTAKTGDRMRVATKYVNLTREFFEARGLADYRIVESQGATEGAPASGSAELIVDITTSGATLAANALKVLDDGTILKSEANLVASLNAPWGAEARAALGTMLTRIAADLRGRNLREVRSGLVGQKLIDAACGKFGCTIFASDDGVSTLHVPEANLYALVDWLRENGAGPVSVTRPDYVFEVTNPLYDGLSSKLGWPS